MEQKKVSFSKINKNCKSYAKLSMYLAKKTYYCNYSQKRKFKRGKVK